MDGAHFIAARASALLHALWNAAIKASANPRQAMAARMIAAAVLALLGLVWAVPPPLAVWPQMLNS